MMADTDVNNLADFCSELRIKTKAVHDQSDRTVNLKLAVVLTDFSLWSEALRDFYYVFQAIETGMEVHRNHPHIRPLAELLLAKGVKRTDAFDSDLQHYVGPDWKGKMQPSAPCMEYCNRVSNIGQESPTVLIAYIHSMYLGLLAGGQIIKKIVKRSLGMSGDEGLTIFEFDTVNHAELKQLLMDAINALELDRKHKDAIIEEKMRVFQMNNMIVNNIKPALRNYARLGKFFVLSLIALLVMIFLVFYTLR